MSHMETNQMSEGPFYTKTLVLKVKFPLFWKFSSCPVSDVWSVTWWCARQPGLRILLVCSLAHSLHLLDALVMNASKIQKLNLTYLGCWAAFWVLEALLPSACIFLVLWSWLLQWVGSDDNDWCVVKAGVGLSGQSHRNLIPTSL